MNSLFWVRYATRLSSGGDGDDDDEISNATRDAVAFHAPLIDALVGQEGSWWCGGAAAGVDEEHGASPWARGCGRSGRAPRCGGGGVNSA